MSGEKKTSGVPGQDDTAALFVTARKKQLADQEDQRIAAEEEAKRLAAEAEVRRLEAEVAERKRKAEQEAKRLADEAEVRRRTAEKEAEEELKHSKPKREALAEADGTPEKRTTKPLPSPKPSKSLLMSKRLKAILIVSGIVIVVILLLAALGHLVGGDDSNTTAAATTDHLDDSAISNDLLTGEWLYSDGENILTFDGTGMFSYEDSEENWYGSYKYDGQSLTLYDEKGNTVSGYLDEDGDLVLDSMVGYFYISDSSDAPVPPDPNADFDEYYQIFGNMNVNSCSSVFDLKSIDENDLQLASVNGDGTIVHIFSPRTLQYIADGNVNALDTWNEEELQSVLDGEDNVSIGHRQDYTIRTDCVGVLRRATFTNEAGENRTVYLFSYVFTSSDGTLYLFHDYMNCPTSSEGAYYTIYDRMLPATFK